MKTARYSARQQRCLQTMGIVPWVSRIPAMVNREEEILKCPELPGIVNTRPVESTPQAGGVSLNTAVVTNATMPHVMEELGRWLPSQPLADFGYKGTVHTILGHPEAPVLVIVQQDERHSGELPLTGEAAQLFELMMRSINLGRSDVRQCALESKKKMSLGQVTVDQTVAAVCNKHTRAVLLLSSGMHDSTDVAAAKHYCRLHGSQLPTWRVAHPDCLIQENLRKRQAWQALKALQGSLAGL